MKTTLIENDFSNFDALAYLQEYYDHIGTENNELLRFFATAFSRVSAGTIMLEFGGGPTIYQLISAAAKVAAIDFSDYLNSNLDQVMRWKDAVPGVFDWSPFISRALQLEGITSVTDQQVAARASLLRQKLRRFLHVDAYLSQPLRDDPTAVYDLVSVNFVPEGITTSKETWAAVIRNICTLVRPGGKLFMTAIEGATHWRVGGVNFTAANISSDDIRQVLKDNGFISIRIYSIAAEVQRDDEESTQGYKGIALVEASQSVMEF